MKHYFFSFSIEKIGVIASELSEQNSRDQLNRELSQMYGPDAVSVTEFRVATDSEIDDYNSRKESSNVLLN